MSTSSSAPARLQMGACFQSRKQSVQNAAAIKQAQANHWARTAQKRSSPLRSLTIAALLIASIYVGVRRMGGGAKALMLGLASNSASGRSVMHVNDEIVFGVFGQYARIAQVKVGRAWRQGHRTVIASDMEELPEGLEADAAQHREIWTFYPDFNEAWHKGDRRGAMLPLLVYRELGDTFKWLFYGDDDTMWLRPNPDILVEAYDANKPHVLTDNWWPDNQKGTRWTHYAPRCLPCHLKPPGSNDTVKVAQGFQAVFACDTPCTPQLLCSTIANGGYGEKWKLWFDATDGLNCTYPNESGSRWQVPTFYALHGGGGAILSVGTMRHMEKSAETYETCTGAEPYKWNTGSDAILTRCLWAIGLAGTDPGFSALPAGEDPDTFPDEPLQNEEFYIMYNVERRRLFGGLGYSNWKDIRAMLHGLPPKYGGDPNITFCPADASLCDQEDQADYLRRAVTTHVGARDFHDSEVHLAFMDTIWQRFHEWRSKPVDSRPPMKAAEVWAMPWR